MTYKRILPLITHSQIRNIRSLSLKKNRKKTSLFVVEGEKIVHDLLQSNYHLEQIFATDDWLANQENFKHHVIRVTSKQLARISYLKTPNKVLALVKIPKENSILDSNLTVVLDNIKDPGNMGTIIRLCDWFGVKQIICSPQTVDIFNMKVVQSSMGSLFRVNINYIDLIKYLSNHKERTIYGSSLAGLAVSEAQIDKSGIIIFGNESNGISKQLIPYITDNITIDGKNKNNVDSLNVATAVAIILHSFNS